MPAANGSRIGIQFVSYLLPCTVVDVAVTENEPLIRILYGFYDRPYLPLQTDIDLSEAKLTLQYSRGDFQ